MSFEGTLVNGRLVLHNRAWIKMKLKGREQEGEWRVRDTRHWISLHWASITRHDDAFFYFAMNQPMRAPAALQRDACCFPCRFLQELHGMDGN